MCQEIKKTFVISDMTDREVDLIQQALTAYRSQADQDERKEITEIKSRIYIQRHRQEEVPMHTSPL